jgi:polyhydroxybutyrate depolymerase
LLADDEREREFETKKITLLLIGLLIATASCQSAPTPIPPTPTAIPPTSAPTSVPLTPTVLPGITTQTPTRVPTLASASQVASIRVGDLERTYVYYVPVSLPRNAPLLLVFHGRGMNADMMRGWAGYQFDRLADKNRFVVVYLDGYQQTWNDCGKSDLPAKTQNIDDVGFVRALIARVHADYGINPSQVFAMGYSNGGFMVFRLALELPDEITAVAAVAANLATDDNSDCRASGKPIPVLIMNGTSDPNVPYNGGVVLLSKVAVTVRSTQESAEYFAKLNGQVNPPKTTCLPHQDVSDPTSVDRTVWNDPGKPEVVLVTINEGGHVVPQSQFIASSSFGRTTKDLDGPVEIWNFFSRQPPQK